MRPIRLFADGHVFDGPYQGTRSFLQGLYTGMADVPGFELHIGTSDPARTSEAFGAAAKAIKFIPYRTANRLHRLGIELPRLLRRHAIDYAHFQYLAPPVKVCRYIVTTHDLLFEDQPEDFPYFYRMLRRRSFRYAARAADIVTTVSAYAAQSLERHYGLSREKTAVIPNGVTQKAELPGPVAEAAPAGGPYLLCVSRFEPRKNQALLLEAFATLRLHERGYRLVFIGSRSLPVPAFERVWAELPDGVKAQVVFLEDVPASELAAWYRHAGLFVYPSLGEGFGIPPLEAAIAGVPVLCSNRTALADFDFLELADPADKEVFAARMDELLTAPPSKEACDRRAAIASARYCWKRSARLFAERIFQDVKKRPL